MQDTIKVMSLSFIGEDLLLTLDRLPIESRDFVVYEYAENKNRGFFYKPITGFIKTGFALQHVTNLLIKSNWLLDPNDFRRGRKYAIMFNGGPSQEKIENFCLPEPSGTNELQEPQSRKATIRHSLHDLYQSLF